MAAHTPRSLILTFQVRYRWFWPGFVAETSFLHAALSRALGTEPEVVADPGVRVDLEMSSVFVARSRRERLVRRIAMNWSDRAASERSIEMSLGYSPADTRSARRTLWYSGENLRPPFEVFDATIGFDPTDAQTANLYWPFWLTRLDWGLGNVLSELAPRPDDLIEPRAATLRPRAACIFTSASEPARMRISAAVESEIPLVRFGRASGNFVASKGTAARDFGFQVCPENDLFPGYVSEKLTESWQCRNVPIWQGLHGSIAFNADAILDVTGQSSVEIRHRLAGVSEDEMLWRQSQPLLRECPRLEPLTEFLQVLIG